MDACTLPLLTPSDKDCEGSGNDCPSRPRTNQRPLFGVMGHSQSSELALSSRHLGERCCRTPSPTWCRGWTAAEWRGEGRALPSPTRAGGSPGQGGLWLRPPGVGLSHKGETNPESQSKLCNVGLKALTFKWLEKEPMNWSGVGGGPKN